MLLLGINVEAFVACLVVYFLHIIFKAFTCYISLRKAEAARVIFDDNAFAVIAVYAYISGIVYGYANVFALVHLAEIVIYRHREGDCERCAEA